MRTRTFLLAALAALVPAPAARAAMLTYVDGGNVWAQNLDGSQRHQITRDGTAANPYLLPTTNDAKALAAFHNGPDGHPYIYWFPTGELPEARKTKLPKQIGDASPSPPTSARMSPLGNDLVYTYLIGGDPARPHYGRVDPADPAQQGAQSDPNFYDFLDVSFYDSGTGPRPVAAVRNGSIWWVGLRSDQPWLTADDPAAKLTAAEASRDGTRLVVRYDTATTRRLLGVGYRGPVHFGEITAACWIPTGSGYTRAAISPDGGTVAWDDAAGLHLADFDPERNDGENCLLANVRTVSATGSQPAFSAATTTAPAAVDPPAPPAPPVMQPPVKEQASLTLTAPKTAKVKALRAGMIVKVQVPAAGRVSASLSRGKKTLATRSQTVTGAKTVSLKLKIARKTKLTRGTKLTLRVQLKPKTGAMIEATTTVKVR